jgi:hypothetical protein
MNMDLITVSNEIKKKIDELDKMRALIRERGEAKAQSIAEYEKAIAKTIIQLRHGVEFDIDGVSTGTGVPATLIEKTSRGICWQERLEMERADALYKSVTTNIMVTSAQLNALQSLFRFLGEA